MINASFKIYWNNPIEMTTLSNQQTLEFNIPLGAIIADPAVSVDLSNYYTKPETNIEINSAVSAKADKTYVDSQDNSLAANINLKASKNYVDQQDLLLQDQINLKANAQAVAQSLSLKADLIDGKVPASQLPSFVDDVLEGTYINPSTFNDLNNQPYIPESGKIYVDTTSNKTYRWSGMLYVVISSGGVILGETSETAYRGDRGKIAYDHSQSQGNPHNSTTSDITEGIRLYFTEPRVRSTPLTGMVVQNSPVVQTDTIAIAVGKLQGQLNTLGATWVSVFSLPGVEVSTSVDVPNSSFQIAKIDGSIWIRGRVRFKANALAGATLFTIYPPYSPDVSWFPYGCTFQRSTLFGDSNTSISFDFVGSNFNSALYINTSTTSSTASNGQTYHLPPTAISRAAN